MCGSASPSAVSVNMCANYWWSNLFRVLVLHLLQRSITELLYASHFEWQQTFTKMSSFPHGLKSECSLLFEPMAFMFWVYQVFAVVLGKKYIRTQLKWHRFKQQHVYDIRYPVVPINFSLLAIKLHFSVITKFVFHVVITESNWICICCFQAIRDTEQHCASYKVSGTQTVVVEYMRDEETDMFQVRCGPSQNVWCGTIVAVADTR